MPNTAQARLDLDAALCAYMLDEQASAMRDLMRAVMGATGADREFARAACAYIAAARNAPLCHLTRDRMYVASKLEVWVLDYEGRTAGEQSARRRDEIELSELAETIGDRLRDERLRVGGPLPTRVMLRRLLDLVLADNVNALRAELPGLRVLIDAISGASRLTYASLHRDLTCYCLARAPKTLTGTPCTLLDPEALYAAIGEAHGIARHSAQGLVCGLADAPPRGPVRAVSGMPALTRDAMTAPEGAPLPTLLSDLCARGLLAPGVYIVGTL